MHVQHMTRGLGLTVHHENLILQTRLVTLYEICLVAVVVVGLSDKVPVPHSFFFRELLKKSPASRHFEPSLNVMSDAIFFYLFPPYL